MRCVTRRDVLRLVGAAGLARLCGGCADGAKPAAVSRRPSEPETTAPEVIANYHCEIGENPLWDDRRQAVYWTDIGRGRLFRYDARTGHHEPIYSGEPVGGFTLQRDGSLLLFQVNAFSILRPDGTLERLADGIDDDMQRFNDVIADPEGRVYAGTIGKTNQSGGLYLIMPDGSVRNLFKGTGCSNGMAFSPDGHHFYWTCTTTRTVFRFDYDRASGALTNRHALIVSTDLKGVPDGLTIDTTGNLWSARWGGYAIHTYTPAGERTGQIDFPVANVSSVIFGGPKLDELYVTTAGGTEGTDGLEGALYRVRVAAHGLPEFRSAVRCG